MHTKKQEKGKIVILTGAGISAESGLATFRGSRGLWENHRVEDVATPEAFEKNPDLVHRFYNERRKKLFSSEIQPNSAHIALAHLEREWPNEVLVVTQNIDDLHEKAGSKNIIHMHGKLWEVRCTSSDDIFTWENDLSVDTICKCCGKTGTLRPHIVWFGEIPLELPHIFQALENCDLFLAIGTSGNVYPASGFVEHVRLHKNAPAVELNLEPSSVSELFSEHQFGPASQVVPQYVEKLLHDRN